MNERQMRAFEALRADQRLLDDAAARLRHEAIQRQYAGFQRQELAFAVASVFDTARRHLDAVPAGLRGELVRVAEALVAAPPLPGGISR